MRRAEQSSASLGVEPAAKARRRLSPGFIDNLRAIGVLGVGAGLLAGTGEVIGDDPLYVADATVVAFQNAFTSCDALPDNTRKYWQEQLKADARKPDPKTGSISTDDARRAQKYGLHLPESAVTIRKQVENAPDPQTAVALANDFMQREYGIEVSARAPVDAADHGDAIDIVSSVHTIPSELVRAVARKDFRKVVLGEEIDREPMPNYHTTANYDPASGTIAFTEGAVSGFPHEFGHALSRAASRNRCTMPTVKEAPDFEILNPVGFAYGGSRWEQITTSQYTSLDVAEDYAGVADALMYPRPATDTCILGKSAIIDSKMAVVAADMESVAPGSGHYFSARLGQECPA